MTLRLLCDSPGCEAYTDKVVVDYDGITCDEGGWYLYPGDWCPDHFPGDYAHAYGPHMTREMRLARLGGGVPQVGDPAVPRVGDYLEAVYRDRIKADLEASFLLWKRTEGGDA